MMVGNIVIAILFGVICALVTTFAGWTLAMVALSYVLGGLTCFVIMTVAGLFKTSKPVKKTTTALKQKTI